MTATSQLQPRAAAPVPARQWDAPVEHIPTACGRLIERRQAGLEVGLVDPGRPVWVPGPDGPREYTPTAEEIERWRANRPRPHEHTYRVWEMTQQRQAMDLIVATCVELQDLGEAQDGNPGGKRGLTGIYRCCGEVRLIGSPRLRAERRGAL